MAERKNYLLNVNGVKAIAKLVPPAKRKRYSDGDSLHLVHDPKGSLYWVMTYRYQSDKDIKPKQKTFHIGTYRSSKQDVDTVFKPDVSLKQARSLRDKAKALLADDIDPAIDKNKHKNSVEQKDLFNVIAQSYINDKADTTPKNVQKLQTYLDKHVAPHIGDYPIQAITAQDVIKTGLAVQTYFEQQGKLTTDTAHKSVAFITSVFEYAINTLGYDIINVAYGRSKALRTHKAERMKAIEQHQFSELLRNIDNYGKDNPNGHLQTVAGMQLMALCFVRTKELRHFEWSEIDYHKSVWRIPEIKMKMGLDHIIPLSPQAMAIIERMRPLTEQTGYVFYNFERSQPYSEVWFNQALKRMGYTGDPYPKMTGHGFRQLASTGLYELQFSKELVEIQLAHFEGSSVKKRYDLSAHLAERQMMMNKWANHLDDLRAGKAVSFDLLTPDELTEEMNSRNEQATDIALHDKDILIKSLRAQGVSAEVLAKLAEQL